MKARELGRRSVVVGDRVAIVGDVSGDTDTLARVVRVEPRTSTLRRTADDTDPFERVIVANADQLVIVTALADPPPRPRLIDRCLVAAFDAGLRPLLCLTKSDLKGPEELLDTYRALDVPHVVTRRGESLGRAALAADRAGERPRRPLGCRQVHAGQRARARSRPRHRRRERGDRPRQARLVVSGCPGARRRRMGDRHPRHPQLRHRPRRPRPHHPRVPRPHAGHRRAARAGAPTTNPTAPSTPGSRPATPTRTGWSRCAGCCAAATNRRRRASQRRPRYLQASEPTVQLQTAVEPR